MFIQLIFILFGLIRTEFVQQEFSPLPESFVCADYHSEDCDVYYVTTNIENIKVGDYVLAQDVETGEVSLKEVTDTFVRTSDHLRYLTTIDEEGDTQTIETTDGHPFWVVTDNPDLSRAAGDFVVENGTILYHENLTVTEHGYYVEAKDLKVGDVFIGANGELTTLTDTYREEFSNGVTVYNFTVADNHNYYVIANLEAYENGASVVLVHNANASLYNRPSGYRAGVRDTVYDNAIEGATGVARDPVTGKFIKREGDWDMGHKPGYEFKKHQQSVEERGISREEFLNEHNDPSHYRPEIPSSNRGHRGESPDGINLW
jgi:hypothetical protein